MIELSNSQARRIALRVQQFGVTRISVPRLVDRLGAIQIDAVNVLIRSHYLPIYSRLGAYDVPAFDRVLYKRAFEYLGHQAAFVPMSLQPAFRWRMAECSRNKHWVARLERIQRERPGYVEAVLAEVTERGLQLDGSNQRNTATSSDRRRRHRCHDRDGFRHRNRVQNPSRS